jgi:hypothetical protein
MMRIGLGLIVPLLPRPAGAQSRLEVHPSVTATEVHDDNVFATADEPVADQVFRLGPGLVVVRTSPRLALQARYRLEAERYRRHRELDSKAASQLATFDADWTPTQVLTARGVLSYASAQTPGALNTLTGLEVGRRPAQQFSTTASLAYRLSAVSSATLEHRFTRQRVEGYPDGDTQSVTLGWQRQLRQRDRGRVGYTARRFDFGADPTVAHIVTFGWTSELGRFTHLDVDAGPSLLQGSVDADVLARLRQRFQHGEASLDYVRTRTTVLGEPGPVTADGVTATAGRRFGPVGLTVAPSLFRVGRDHSTSTVRRLMSEVSWRVSRGLAVVASHQFTRQYGGIGVALPARAEISHNTFQVGIAAPSAALP